jgi:hypothetical protein
MPFKWILIAIIFFAGLYTTLNYSSQQFREGFDGQPRCPDILIQEGEELILKNSSIAEVPGVNPLRFKNLEEYSEFVRWQKSQNIHCPVLFLKKTYDAQSHEGYLPTILPPINLSEDQFQLNEYTDKPPFGNMDYPSMDLHNQDIGANTALDQYHNIGESDLVSANPTDNNWGGAEFAKEAVDRKLYNDNEVYKLVGT